jgi:hypothetical protein
MLRKLQQAIIGLNARAERSETLRTLRTTLIRSASLFRAPDNAEAALRGIMETEAQHNAETSSWVDPESLAAGEGGAFDACDLRHWLVLAERAGVPAVPAKIILTLSEDEMNAASGVIEIPDNAVTRRLAKSIRQAAADMNLDTDPETVEVDQEHLADQLFTAMDDVPEGWMVRSNRCGSSELKAMAGFGAIGHQVPEVRFGPDLEFGPGWVRVGNRRRVHVSDKRTIEAAAQGPGFLCFLARPWQECSRYLVGEDPHRHGTPFAGKGVWPAEWRAIVEGGVVVGVASYYGWCDQATPETARTAIKVRDLAQRIVDEAMSQKAWPRYPDIELARDAKWIETDSELGRALAKQFSRATVSCTIDFIETDEGPMFLEAGPAVSPFGGGHPCAFAGAGVQGKLGRIPNISGVAFRIMDHVILADPSTWEDGDRTDCVLSWSDVEALAMEPSAALAAE